MTLYYWEYYDFMDIGKYVLYYIYLYYVYLMTRMMTSGYLYVCILVIMTIDWKLRRMS